MGAPPRTKSDYMRKIASKRADLARARAAAASCRMSKDKAGAYAHRQRIAGIQAEIAMLQAKMYDAPRR